MSRVERFERWWCLLSPVVLVIGGCVLVFRGEQPAGLALIAAAWLAALVDEVKLIRRHIVNRASVHVITIGHDREGTPSDRGAS